MKKLTLLFLAAFLAIGIIACTEATTTTATTAGTTSTGTTTAGTTTTGGTTTTQPTTQPSTTTTTTTTEAIDVENVYIHFNVTMLAVELLNVKCWGQDEGGTWLADYYLNFTAEDDYGVIAVVPIGENGRATLGFAIIPGTTWEPVAPQIDSVDFTEVELDGDLHIYVVKGESTVAYGTAPEGVEKLGINVDYIPNIVVNQGGDAEVSLLIDEFDRNGVAVDGVTFSGNVALTERMTHLRVDYTATNGITADAAIYKAAMPNNSQGQFAYLALIMKGSNGASINDLKLAFRFDDNHELITVPFADLVDPDLEALPELTGEYQIYIVNIPDTLDGLTFLAKSGYTDVAAGGSIVGFHLLADGLSEGTLEIQSIYYTNDAVTVGVGENDFVIDDFQRVDVGAAVAGIWWHGSVGYIVGLWLTMADGAEDAVYVFDNAPIGDYQNVAIRLSGAAGQDLLIRPVFDDGVGGTILGTAVLLSALLGPENAVIGTLAGGFQTVLIHLANSGWGDTLCGLSITVETGAVSIDWIQYKSFFEVDAAKYPTIAADDLVVFDGFDRAILGATAAYDPANPVALANGLYYIISYTNSEALGKLYVEEDALVFDCTSDSGYINFVEASQTGNLGTHKYLVFKMKTDEGGSFGDFRFQTGSGNVVWANQFLAAPDLSSFASPYVSNDGWTYVVIDLALSGFLPSFEELTMYYSGSGRLLIDSIFFANDDYPRLDLENRTVADVSTGTQVFTAGAEYQYNYVDLDGTNPLNQRYMVFVLKGTGLANFRFQTHIGGTNSDVKYITDLKGVNGFTYSLDDFAADGYRYLIVDLVASGLQLNPEGLHLHLNDAQVFLAEIFFADTVAAAIDPTELGVYQPDPETVIDGSAAGYLYTYVNFDGVSAADYLVMVVKGDLTSIRFATINDDESAVSNVVWIQDLIGPNGVRIAYQPTSTEYQTIVVDLAASGLGTEVSALHFHYGNDSATDILTIQKMYLIAKPAVALYDESTLVTLLAPEQTVDAMSTEYTYTYFGFSTPLLGQRYLILNVTGDATALRFEAIKANDSTVAVKWLWDLKGIDGNALVYSTELGPQTLVIDLVASGIGTDIKALHFHYGNASSTDLIVVHSFQAANPIDPTLLIAAAIGE